MPPVPPDHRCWLHPGNLLHGCHALRSRSHKPGGIKAWLVENKAIPLIAMILV